jgi:hypothetical protein
MKPGALITVDPVVYPRGLKPMERERLKSLSRRKLYDCNHPKEKLRYPILRRAFVPADYRGNPTVVLLCAISQARLVDGTFEFVVFVDGLHGAGHWPSDKYGAGTLKDALAAFEENLVYELFGHWPWVIRKHLRKVKKIMGNVKKIMRP